MTKHGKKYTDAMRRYDRERVYPPSEGLELVKSLATRKFDETVEAAFRLGVDPRKADQMIRGTVSLPNGTGKQARVVVFAAGDAAREAEQAGADIVGADDLVKRIEDGFLDFDVAIATPDLMAQVGKLGRTLGPRGLMPNPKTGTVTNDVGKTVEEFKAGKVEYRTDRYGNVHVPIGKASFAADQLLANYHAVLDELMRAKPASAKGRYLKAASASSSMGPGVKLDPAVTRADEHAGSVPERRAGASA
jgi:large subunit ribosomal protein L1